jgi:alcohol dehydrogenase class IV
MLLDAAQAQRLLLVIDRGAVAASDIEAELRLALAGREVAEFSEFTPNPKSEQAAAAARAAQAHGADAVVAIGGGSCMDVAKVAALASCAGDTLDAVTRGAAPPTDAALPIIAVPTTSGTGSEATHFAAIYVDGRKISLAHRSMRPVAVVLDVRLHAAMPQRLAAETGLDALAQALESLWAVGSTAESLRFAEAAGPLLASALVRSAVKVDHTARIEMMLGSHLAGQAINLGKTTAAHALSYALTQGYGIAHGHAVALTLGHVGAANYTVDADTCLDARGPAHVRAQVGRATETLGCTPGELPRVIAELMQDLGLPSSLADAGVPRDALPALAAAADLIRLSNNPMRLSTEKTLLLLEDAWAKVGD